MLKHFRKNRKLNLLSVQAEAAGNLYCSKSVRLRRKLCMTAVQRRSREKSTNTSRTVIIRRISV